MRWRRYGQGGKAVASYDAGPKRGRGCTRPRLHRAEEGRPTDPIDTSEKKRLIRADYHASGKYAIVSDEGGGDKGGGEKKKVLLVIWYGEEGLILCILPRKKKKGLRGDHQKTPEKRKRKKSFFAHSGHSPIFQKNRCFCVKRKEHRMRHHDLIREREEEQSAGPRCPERKRVKPRTDEVPAVSAARKGIPAGRGENDWSLEEENVIKTVSRIWI